MVRSFRDVVMLVFLCAAAGVAGGEGNVDLLFHSGHAPADIRFAGLAGSGTALPTGVLSTCVNPALIHTVAKTQELRGLLSGLSYAHQNPVYDGNVVTVGAAYYSKKNGTIGNVYRYLQGDGRQQTDYQAVAAYAGQLFESSAEQGAVDYGINLRYEQANWNTYGYSALPLYVRTPSDTALYDSSEIHHGSRVEKRMVLDLGFFQSRIMKNLDFALVFHNLLGFAWGESQPHYESVHDSLGGDSVLTGVRYVDAYQKSEDWIDGWYRRITVGIAFHSLLLDGDLVVRVPMDVEVIGLLDRGRDAHWMIRLGAEAAYRRYFVARFGYARRPLLVELGEQPVNENHFSVGAGLRIQKLCIDGYLGFGEQGTGEWGGAVSFNY